MFLFWTISHIWLPNVNQVWLVQVWYVIFKFWIIWRIKLKDHANQSSNIFTFKSGRRFSHFWSLSSHWHFCWILLKNGSISLPHFMVSVFKYCFDCKLKNGFHLVMKIMNLLLKRQFFSFMDRFLEYLTRLNFPDCKSIH